MVVNPSTLYTLRKNLTSKKAVSAKKIAIVANTSWYVYNLRLGVIRRLKEEGYEVLVITPKDSYTHYLLSEDYQHVDINIQSKGKSLFSDLRYFRKLLQIYKSYEPDFIFHYTIKPNVYGSLAARVAGIKSIAVVSGAGHTFLKKNFLYRVISLMYRLAFQFTKQVWFVNKDDLNEFVEHRIIPKGKAQLLPGEGVNIQHFSPNFDRMPNKNSMNFLLSARLLWDKGIGQYVEAAKIIKSKYSGVNFYLLGFLDVENPSAISSTQIYDWHHNGDITYLGKTEDVRPYVANCDCFVLPSYYREGTPRSLLEAAAMAKPIITTDNVGCREVVKDGYNGFLCEPKNVDDLVKKMEMMIGMTTQQRHMMGLNGRKFVIEYFDEQLVVERYVSVLQTA
jgi:glycosyltransferase involved in cell wall biosynthesis